MAGKRAEPYKGIEEFGDLSSKKDLYDHQNCVLQVSSKFNIQNTIFITSKCFKYYMPNFEMFTKDFVKEMLAGKKKLMKKREVKYITVKKYDELSVKNLYNDFLALPGMADYFPDRYAVGR